MVVLHTFHLGTVMWPITRKQRLKLCCHVTHLNPRQVCGLLEKDLVESQTPFNLSLCFPAMSQAYLLGEKA